MRISFGEILGVTSPVRSDRDAYEARIQNRYGKFRFIQQTQGKGLDYIVTNTKEDGRPSDEPGPGQADYYQKFVSSVLLLVQSVIPIPDSKPDKTKAIAALKSNQDWAATILRPAQQLLIQNVVREETV